MTIGYLKRIAAKFKVEFPNDDWDHKVIEAVVDAFVNYIEIEERE